MLLRAKSFPALCLLLAAFVAWPANIPLFARPDPPRIAKARPAPDSRAGVSVGRVDADSWARWADCAVVGGDLEEADGSDGPRLMPLAPRIGPPELPSLVPSSLQGRRPEVVGPPARASRSTLLRC